MADTLRTTVSDLIVGEKGSTQNTVRVTRSRIMVITSVLDAVPPSPRAGRSTIIVT